MTGGGTRKFLIRPRPTTQCSIAKDMTAVQESREREREGVRVLGIDADMRRAHNDIRSKGIAINTISGRGLSLQVINSDLYLLRPKTRRHAIPGTGYQRSLNAVHPSPAFPCLKLRPTSPPVFEVRGRVDRGSKCSLLWHGAI